MVVISISTVLFFLSSFVFFVLNSNKIVDDFKEKIPVVVFFKDEASKIELSQFEKKLSIDDGIKEFVYTSKDDAAVKFSSEIGENFVDYLGYNPLLNSIDIYFYANKVETSYINDVVKIFEKEDFVYEVSYDAPLIFLINDNFKKVKDWVLVLAIFFVFISILLIIVIMAGNMYRSVSMRSVYSLKKDSMIPSWLTSPMELMAKLTSNNMFKLGLFAFPITIWSLTGMRETIINNQLVDG